MELLDLLEQRVSALLARLDALSAENRMLKEAQEQELRVLADENKALQDQLEQERGRNTSALSRIEALVERIREQAHQE